MRRIFQIFSLLFLAGSVAACAGIESQRPEENPIPEGMAKGPGLFSGDSGNILDAFRQRESEAVGASASIGVNGYLWRGALETVSFMPIAQADSAGGVIITDWHTSSQNPDERFKVNVYILSQTLRADGVRVSSFKQKRENGEWQDVSVGADTNRQLEDTILTRARKLRVQDRANGAE